jgi:hypothetical protein
VDKQARYRAMAAYIRKSPEVIPGRTFFERFYPADTEWNTFQKDISNFNKWLEQKYGLIWQSTVCYRLQDADIVRDYRRNITPTST